MAAFTVKYKFLTGHHKVSAQVAGEEMERLAKSEQGLSPRTLLDASRDENAPLHSEFEWDDAIAAENYRLGQAGDMIMQIKVVESSDTQEREQKTYRGFVPTPGHNNVFVTMDTALRKEDYRADLLKRAEQDAKIFMAKYRTLEELSEVITAMEAFVKVG